MAEASKTNRFVHVVAGILIDDGRICITRRHNDAHQGGKWEFPGGKLEAGEEPAPGLKRELREELGIEVQDAVPFIQVRHTYPELNVLLDVWRVQRYTGTPHGRESQELRWASVVNLDPSEFPDADRPVLRRLQLPRLYLISDVRRFGERQFIARLEQALAAGARLVQLRERHMDRASFCAYAREIAALCHRFSARLLVNSDPEWFPECDADGVHLNSRQLMTLPRRPISVEYWLGASCHNAAELQRANALRCDLAVLGPVHPTESHPGAPALGWDRFRALAIPITVPLYAIGGMREQDLSSARSAGAQGLAMISGVWGADNMESLVANLSRAGPFD